MLQETLTNDSSMLIPNDLARPLKASSIGGPFPTFWYYHEKPS